MGFLLLPVPHLHIITGDELWLFLIPTLCICCIFAVPLSFESSLFFFFFSCWLNNTLKCWKIRNLKQMLDIWMLLIYTCYHLNLEAIHSIIAKKSPLELLPSYLTKHCCLPLNTSMTTGFQVSITSLNNNLMLHGLRENIAKCFSSSKLLLSLLLLWVFRKSQT